MRTTCLINNYNYCPYLGEAVDSALGQTRPFDEIVVVDDGSTDGSVAFLREAYALEPRIRIVAKDNGGQLSAFNTGAALATGDLLFFLDADDRYHPSYLDQAVAVYQQRAVDFVIAGVETFGPAAGAPRLLKPRRDVGYSALATLFGQVYVGGPTSALSMRKSIADRVLPYPHIADWRTRADDVLVLAASIVGARKFHLGRRLVDYRLHGANRMSGRQQDAADRYHHSLAVNRVLRWYAQREGFDLPDLPRWLHREFATIGQPTWGELSTYLWMSWRAKLTWQVRARHFVRMVTHSIRELRRTPLEGVEDEVASDRSEIRRAA